MVEAHGNAQEETKTEVKGTDTFLTCPQILDQLKAASKITDEALAMAATLCVADASVWSICQAIDEFLLKGLQGVYNSKKTKKTERGLSMPTCVSINNIMGHYSPLEEDSVKLATGDVCKVITGCHIDGWASNAAFTCVVGSSESNKVTGAQNDVTVACHAAMLAAQRAIVPGATNNDVSRAIARVCE